MDDKLLKYYTNLLKHMCNITYLSLKKSSSQFCSCHNSICSLRCFHHPQSFLLLLLLSRFSLVGLLATPWTAAYQAPPSMGFARQEYWSGLPLPSPQSFLMSPFFKKKSSFLGGFFFFFFFSTEFLKSADFP